MKPDPRNPDPLDSLLSRWEPKTSLPPQSLAPEVWRRIAAAEIERRDFWTRLHAVFARPSFAAAFVAACVLLGLFLGEMRRSRLQAAHETALVHGYLCLIDPLAAMRLEGTLK